MQGSALAGQVGVNYCTTRPRECIAHEMGSTSFGNYFAMHEKIYSVSSLLI